MIVGTRMIASLTRVDQQWTGGMKAQAGSMYSHSNHDTSDFMRSDGVKCVPRMKHQRNVVFFGESLTWIVKISELQMQKDTATHSSLLIISPDRPEKTRLTEVVQILSNWKIITNGEVV